MAIKPEIRISISKKLIGAHAAGLVLFLLLAVFSYLSLTFYAVTYEKNNALARRMELVADLQILMQKILMPPNDYLITGDKKERRNFANIVTETASTLEKVRVTGKKTSEETAIANEVEKDFIELQQKAMVLLSTEKPVGNKEAAALMEDMDAFADALVGKTEKLHKLVRVEREAYDKKAHKVNTRMSGIFIFLTIFSLAGMLLLGLIIRRKVVRPLSELTGAATVIGGGNLDYRINIKTGDELEGLGMEFNNMAQSLKDKIEEIKEYSKKLEKTNLQLDQNVLQLYALYSISKTLATTLEMEKLLNQVVEGVSQALKLHRINIMLVNEDRTELFIVSEAGTSGAARDARFKMGEGIYGWIALTGNAEVINDLSSHPRFNPVKGLDDDISSLISAPFKGRGQVIGVINAYRLGGEVFDEASYELLVAAAIQIGIALENARLFEATKVLAVTDGMTALYNYRYFTERLNEEFERARRYKRELSIILLDIDFFKKYNDAHGHPEGDDLLREFSRILRKVMRDSDIIARYGGEEFVVILTEADKKMALETAERLRKEVESKDFRGGETQPGGRVTVSLGVASYTEGVGSADELVKNADNALYRAKEEGRNRVCA